MVLGLFSLAHRRRSKVRSIYIVIDLPLHWA